MPNPDNEPQIPKNQSPITDDRTGMVSRDWYRFFLNLLNKANQGGSGSGTVTSVNVSGGTTGLTTSGGPVTTSGTITLAGTLDVDNGGTGATTAAGARTNLDVPSTSGSGATGTWGINITGNAVNVTGTVAIANGGTGQTTASAAFNALSPITTAGDLILGNGVNSSTRLPIGANTYVLTSNGTTATWTLPTGSGATITNDTATSSDVYPTFAAATSGTLSTIYTSNAKLLYKPSTGELTSSHLVAGNGIFVNSLTISTSYTIAAGTSGMSAGTITIASGVTVTVSSGSRWVVV
jgi:hypothetical protein